MWSMPAWMLSYYRPDCLLIWPVRFEKRLSITVVRLILQNYIKYLITEWISVKYLSLSFNYTKD